jgi:hypothetical protein
VWFAPVDYRCARAFRREGVVAIAGRRLEIADRARVGRDFVINESVERSEHRRGHGSVESGIDEGGVVQEDVGVVALGEGVDVGEVAGLCAVEKGDELPSCEFFVAEGGAGHAGRRRVGRRCVKGEVDDEVLGVGYDQAEGGAVADAPG